jgi:OmpA-OmpF porin, OOP family
MKSLLVTCTFTVALLASGCATKKYVRNTTTPIQAKVDEVGQQTATNSKQIDDTRNQVKQVDEKAQSGISAAQERGATADQHAAAADQHAGEAMNKANQAAQTGDRNTEELNSLRSVVSNIDDFQVQTSATVSFKFDKWALNDDAKQELDKLAEGVKSDKRFFIAVEGYTDRIGSNEYNEALSKKRADAVVEYLVAKHDIPIYRIQMVGLGKEKPVDEARNRTALAKNRRVEVKVFSADQATASLQSSQKGAADRVVQQDR